MVLGREEWRVRGEGASARRKGEERGAGSGIDGQWRRHGVVAERSSRGGVLDGADGQQRGRLDGASWPGREQACVRSELR